MPPYLLHPATLHTTSCQDVKFILRFSKFILRFNKLFLDINKIFFDIISELIEIKVPF